VQRSFTEEFTGELGGGRQTIGFAGQYVNPVVNPTLRFTLIRTFRFLNSKERDMTEFERKKAIALMILALLGGFIFFCS
jgi:hypothetical protein